MRKGFLHLGSPSALVVLICFCPSWIVSFSLRADVIVRPVRHDKDISTLADLRYDEFIKPTDGNSIPREAFRMATAELHQERQHGSVAFLAWKGEVAVGATEISSLELQKAELNPVSSKMLYATDLVVSECHRRQGIAGMLVDEMERYCKENGVDTLLLHIKPNNEPARRLYEARNFQVSDANLLARLDIDKLNENAGTHGQILLYKDFTRIGKGFGAKDRDRGTKRRKNGR